MNKNNKQIDIQQLYQQFQQQRDAVPTPILRTIMLAAKNKLSPVSSMASAEASALSTAEHAQEQEHAETQINAILQAAKQATNSTVPHQQAAHSDKGSEKTSWLTKLNRFTQGLFSPQFGAAPAMALCLVAVVGLALFNKTQLGSIQHHATQNSNGLDITYLENCSICGQVAANSTIKLRSFGANIGVGSDTDATQVLRQALSSTNGSGKFGRYTLGLQLLDSTNNQTADTTGENAAAQNRATLLNAIKLHARKKNNAPIIEYFDKLDQKQILPEQANRDMVAILTDTFTNDADAKLYYAGQWLERLRVTYAGAFYEGITANLASQAEQMVKAGEKVSLEKPSNQHIIQAFNHFDEFTAAIQQSVANVSGNMAVVQPYLTQLAALKSVANTAPQAKVDAEQIQQADFAIKKLLYALDM